MTEINWSSDYYKKKLISFLENEIKTSNSDEIDGFNWLIEQIKNGEVEKYYEGKLE